MSQVNITLDPTRTSQETSALEAHLRKLIVGQDEAVREITSMYQKDLVGMTALGRPVGSLLLLGPARRDENEALSGRIERSALLAVRRKFSAEFINRLDKIIVYQPLGVEELRKILDIELDTVQQRIFATSGGAPFVFETTEAAKSHLLQRGVDLKYGARHLRRTIERLLVQPLSNLIATSQITVGDCIQVDFDGVTHSLKFLKEQDTSPSPQLPEMMRRHTASLVSTPAKAASGNRAITVRPMPLRRN